MKRVKEKVIEKAFGSWKDSIKGSSTEYIRKLRKEWNNREERL